MQLFRVNAQENLLSGIRNRAQESNQLAHAKAQEAPQYSSRVRVQEDQTPTRIKKPEAT